MAASMPIHSRVARDITVLAVKPDLHGRIDPNQTAHPYGLLWTRRMSRQYPIALKYAIIVSRKRIKTSNDCPPIDGVR